MKLSEIQQRWLGRAGLAVIVLAALSLRLVNLGAEELSLDEAFSVINAQHSLREITRIIQQENYPPLYPYLLHGWQFLFGVGVVAARSLSVLIGLISVMVIYLFGRDISSRAVGVGAAAITAFSALHIEFSQEARMYILLFLLSVLSMLFLWRGLTQGRAHWFIFFTLATVANLYTHYFALTVLLGQMIFTVGYFIYQRAARQRLRRYFIVSVAAACLAFIPWLPYLVQRIVWLRQGFWITQYPPRFVDILAILPQFFFLDFSYGRTITIYHWLSPAYYIISFGFLAGAILFLWRIPDRKPSLWYLLTSLITPLAAALASGIYNLRYVMGIAPVLYVLWAVGLCSLRRWWRQTLVIALAVVMLLPSLIEVTRLHYDWAGLGADIASRERPGDVILLYSPMHRYLFNYYYHGTSSVKAYFPTALPQERENEMAIMRYSGWLMITPESLDTEMGWLTRRVERVWLVQYQQPILDADNLIVRWMSRHYQRVSTNDYPFRFGGENIAVVLYQKNSL